MKISYPSYPRNAIAVLVVASSFLSTARADLPDDLLFEAQPLTPAQAPRALSTRVPEPAAPNPAFAGFVPDFNGVRALHEAGPPQLRQSIAAYERSISTMQVEQGPYAAPLAEQFMALARLHLQSNEYSEALDVLAKAEHIARVNHGLNSPEQFPAVELSIECYLRQKDYQHAVERQEYLVHLHNSHYGRNAVEVVPELAQLGDMYFDAFERGIHRDTEDNLKLTFGPQSNFLDPHQLSTTETAFLWLRQAQSQYSTSITKLIEHERYFDPQLLTLETNLIETLFLQAHRRYLELDADFFMSAVLPNQRDVLQFDERTEKMPGYREGEKAFTRIQAYLVNNPEVEPVQVAQAIIGLGDWHILFGKQRQGMEKYEEAHEYLKAKGVAPEVIAGLLAPAVPVQLPTFLAQPNTLVATTPAAPVFEGYIDVAFTLHDTGTIGDIEVLAKSDNADPTVEMRLRRVLRNAPFRPRLAEAAISSADERVAVRYNFARTEGSGG